MKQISITLLISLCIFILSCKAESSNSKHINESFDNQVNEKIQITVGAEKMNEYIPLLENKKVGLVVNHTSMVQEKHLADTLIKSGVKIIKIFAPEHGFRGTADAGETIKDGIDLATGIPVISLYGSNKKPTNSQVEDIDVLIFDIQDVGARFYTFISTLHYIMEAAAENNKKVIILDRPNPNGHYVSGPVLDLDFQSFVGMHPVPIVHGMTVGEYGMMVNNEGWLKNGIICDLEIITCENYTHNTFYELPIKPSPNLPNMRSIYLYPSICLFEGTMVSEGRGTPYPFQQFGLPNAKQFDHSFIPGPTEGAKNPKHNNVECYGRNLSDKPIAELRNMGLTIEWLIEMYHALENKANFFNDFFNKLAGNSQLQKDIKAGLSEEEIFLKWEPEVNAFKTIRKKYLLYQDFE